MSDARTVPVFLGHRDSVSGVEASLKAGDSPAGPAATWHVSAASLGGVKPRPGDRMCGTDGVWWRVRSVAPLADGAYPCLCDRETEAAT